MCLFWRRDGGVGGERGVNGMGQVRAGGAGPAVLGVDWPVLPSLPSPRAGAGRRRHGLAALPSRSPGTPPAGEAANK